MANPLFNVSGLASGLDTNLLVEQLIALERQPQVRVQQQQRVAEARTAALQDIKTKLLALKTAAAGLRDATTWGDVQSVETADASKVGGTRTAGAAAGAYSIAITQLARAHQVGQQSALATAAADDTLHIAVGGGAAVDVAIAAGDTLQTIADKVNGASGIGVYATVVSDRLYLSGRTTGAASTIAATSDGSLAADLSFVQTLSAQDAQYSVDGVARTSASNTVTDAIVGLTLTLKGQTSTNVAITVGAPAPDTATIKTKVQAFVDQYNATVDAVRAKLTEQKVREPSSDADRAKGVLFNDTGLSILLGRLRQTLSDVVSGRPAAFDQLSEVGLSTGSAATSGTPNPDAVAGKLTLDTARLTEKLGSSLADVKALFTSPGDDYASQGLSQRIDAIVASFTESGGIMDGRIDAARAQADMLGQRSEAMEQRLTLREKQLRAQFTAMESALRAAQSQGSYLAGQLASVGL
jgi:flagellar hook-associated protein 2